MNMSHLGGLCWDHFDNGSNHTLHEPVGLATTYILSMDIEL